MVLTMNLWVLLGLALLIGIVFGLFVSNAGKYKKLWRTERRERERIEQERDAQLREREERLAQADARITELERSRSQAAVPVPPADGAARGRDRLAAIGGMAPRDEVALNEAGYYRYDQIANLSAEEERVLEQRLGLVPGTIGREDWREQAKLLAEGRTDEHLARFGQQRRVRV